MASSLPPLSSKGTLSYFLYISKRWFAHIRGGEMVSFAAIVLELGQVKKQSVFVISTKRCGAVDCGRYCLANFSYLTF